MTETPASPDPADEPSDAPPALHEEDTDPEATGDPVPGDLGPQGDADPSPASPTPPPDEGELHDLDDVAADLGVDLTAEEEQP